MEDINIKNNILDNIKLVTDGIIKDIGVNNSFSSWKNTEKGLRFIIEDTDKFCLGIKLWVSIVESQILHCDNDDILKTMATTYKWLDNFLEIKKKLK
jgi:hypothetical protein